MQNLAAKTINGFKWTSISTALYAVMQIGYTALMARLLDPTAFGIMAAADYILRFGEYFSHMGIAFAIVQKPNIGDKDVRAAFTICSILGLVLFGLMYVAAPYLEYLLSEKPAPILTPVIHIMSANFLLVAFHSVAPALLRREMDFKTLTFIEVSSYVVSWGVGAVMGYLGYGIWSLVAVAVVRNVLFAAMAFWAKPHSIMPIFEWEYYKHMLGYGGKISLISFVEFQAANIDRLLIMRFFGPGMLGIFRQAWEIVSLPVYKITIAFNDVLFPAFSRIQDDRARFEAAYLKATMLISYLMFPMCLGVAAASHYIVLTVLGDKWLACVPILQILALGMPFRANVHLNGIVCEAASILNAKAAIEVGKIVVQVVVYVCLGYWFGMNGFAAGFVVGESLLLLFYLFALHRLLGFGKWAMVRGLLPALFSGLLTGAAIYATGLLLQSAALPAALALICQMAVGGLMLLLLLFAKPNAPVRAEVADKLKKVLNLSDEQLKANALLGRTFRLLEV